MGVLELDNCNYKKTMFQGDFKVKGTLFVDANNEEEAIGELNNCLSSKENKRKFLIELMRSATSEDVEINEIEEIF